MDTLIEYLDLSAHAHNAIFNNNFYGKSVIKIRTIGDICKLTEIDLLNIPKLGKKSLQEIKDALHALGLKLMENNLLTIKQAAHLLGCTPNSLRNWEKQKKLVPHRHPMNNYRMYKREDIEKLVKEINGNY